MEDKVIVPLRNWELTKNKLKKFEDGIKNNEPITTSRNLGIFFDDSVKYYTTDEAVSKIAEELKESNKEKSKLEEELKKVKKMSILQFIKWRKK